MNDKTIKIRDAVTEDIAALTELVNELGYKTAMDEMAIRFQHILHHPDHRTFIAMVDNSIAGMAGAIKQFSYQQNGYYVRIIALITDKSYRQTGAGKKLVEAVEEWANELGANSILVNCGNKEERKRAHEFYKRMGFEIKATGYVKKI